MKSARYRDHSSEEPLLQVEERGPGGGGVEFFEDLIVWQEAKALCSLVYECSSAEPLSFDYPLRDQMRRSVISISSNIAEGFERGTRADFIRFLYYAKGSAGELRSQLALALDQRYIGEAQYQILHEQCMSIGRLIGAFINRLQEKRD